MPEERKLVTRAAIPTVRSGGSFTLKSPGRPVTRDRERGVKGGPAGTVTMLFSDIEGSTLSVKSLGPDRWERILEVHSRIIRAALATYGGTEVRTEGDSFFAVFTSPTAAIAAIAAMQRPRGRELA
ncbi:MAG: hypothetical protein M3T56_15735 [Chloroflexota bacterium]|nr:hypothetical protein [Chloroflexota bacterium]